MLREVFLDHYQVLLKVNSQEFSAWKRVASKTGRKWFDLGLQAFAFQSAMFMTKRIGDLTTEQQNKLGNFFSKPTLYDIELWTKNTLRHFGITLGNERVILDKTFEEIERLVKSTKGSSLERAEAVAFLERCIRQYFPMMLRNVEIEVGDASLSTLRRNSRRPFNTLCQACGNPLKRNVVTRRVDDDHANPAFCRSTENRSCYEMRRRTRKGRPKPSLHGTKCQYCNTFLFTPVVRKHRGATLTFCTQRHYETYRKRERRAQKR